MPINLPKSQFMLKFFTNCQISYRNHFNFIAQSYLIKVNLILLLNFQTEYQFNFIVQSLNVTLLFHHARFMVPQ